MSATQERTREQTSPYLDYSGACKYVGLSRQTLWRAVKSGQLRISGPPAARRFHKADLDEFMREAGTR